MLLSKPKLVLMDESTSALDTANERLLYRALRDAGITFVSVGHRCALKPAEITPSGIDGTRSGRWHHVVRIPLHIKLGSHTIGSMLQCALGSPIC